MNSVIFSPGRLPATTMLLSLAAGLLTQAGTLWHQFSEPYFHHHYIRMQAAYSAELRCDFDAVERIWRTELNHSPANIFEEVVQSEEKKELARTLFRRSRYLNEPPSNEIELLYADLKRFEGRTIWLATATVVSQGRSLTPYEDETSLELAKLYAAQKRWAKAERAFKDVFESVATYNDSAPARRHTFPVRTTDVARAMVEFYESQGRHADAETVLQKTLTQETEPDMRAFIQERLGALYLRHGKYEAARVCLEQSHTKFDDDSLPFLEGLTAWMQGKIDIAETQLAERVQFSRRTIVPNDDFVVGLNAEYQCEFSDRLLSLAMLYLSTNRKEQAKPLLKEAINASAELLRGKFHLSANDRLHAQKEIEYANRLLDGEIIDRHEIIQFVVREPQT